MPGWYIHMEAARRALANLATHGQTPTAPGGGPFGKPGPKAADLTQIAKDNPAYAALGAIGPDIFFFLPDFTTLGASLWGVANTVHDIFDWWDANFLRPYEDNLLPVTLNAKDLANELSGGLLDELQKTFKYAHKFIVDTMMVVASRQYDWFGLLGSGVPNGFDEQTFFWSDMLHYRKTYDFAHHLWMKATKMGNRRFQAFALGWMTHLATDVTGHAFVNEKNGGPYRLHWQRHHLIENHMDAAVYDFKYGDGTAPMHIDNTDPNKKPDDDPLIYQMLSCASLHLWLAFNPDGSSLCSFFDDNTRPRYRPMDKTADELDRMKKLDIDSKMPGDKDQAIPPEGDLAKFISDALREFYTDAHTAKLPNGMEDPKGMVSAHPTILEDRLPGSMGYPDPQAVAVTYWWLYDYLKHTTTDYFSFRKPEPPKLLGDDYPYQFPSPPWAGAQDDPPGAAPDNFWQAAWELFLAILGFILYLGEILTWVFANLTGPLVALITKAPREFLYYFVELPLYQAWLAMHHYLALTGFVFPMQGEIAPGMHTLGEGIAGDGWAFVVAALDDPSGGLLSKIGVNPPLSPKTYELSGSDRDQVYPIDVVADPQQTVQQIMLAIFKNFKKDPACGQSEVPSEFLRPWMWPVKDNQKDDVMSEPTLTRASPYKAGDDATVLFTPAPGNPVARVAFEGAQSELATQQVQANHLPSSHLGDPVDYAAYVVGQLTRDDASGVANFNLDADRGYGYLAWDWTRTASISGVPAPFRSNAGAAPDGVDLQRQYNAPLRPGSGWCDLDLLPHQKAAPANEPTMHDPMAKPPMAVKIRYIDREKKFQ